MTRKNVPKILLGVVCFLAAGALAVGVTEMSAYVGKKPLTIKTVYYDDTQAGSIKKVTQAKHVFDDGTIVTDTWMSGSEGFAPNRLITNPFTEVTVTYDGELNQFRRMIAQKGPKARFDFTYRPASCEVKFQGSPGFKGCLPSDRKVLGFPTLKAVIDFSDPSNRTKDHYVHSNYVAPDLNFEVLYFVAEKNGVQQAHREAIEVVLGEPDPRIKEIPKGAVEVIMEGGDFLNLQHKARGRVPIAGTPLDTLNGQLPAVDARK